MSHAIPFPQELPIGFEWLKDEVAFNPARHLALEFPNSRLKLEELGYKQEVLKTKPLLLLCRPLFAYFQKRVRKLCSKHQEGFVLLPKEQEIVSKIRSEVVATVRDGSETYA